jgi:hypothetical protein
VLIKPEGKRPLGDAGIGKNSIKMDLRAVALSWEHSNEPLCTVNGKVFLDQLSDH